ncbi:nucleotidyltransferase domain-containing protein [Candidatus Woesearchaeota archaeon]|nr:nucleotidyltransferase domain-containing protein [Candidatus Woesearchaeota archaeon]
MEEPEKEFHVREIARITEISPTTTSKILKGYVKKGLLNQRKAFSHLLFKANLESKKFKDMKLYYNIKKLRASGIIEYIINQFNEPEAIILFGSYYKAENIKKSDIDLLVISPIKKELKLEKFEKELGHKIQLFIYSNKEIERMKEKNKELLNNFINGMIIHGFWEVFR